MTDERRRPWWRRWPVRAGVILVAAGVVAATVQPVRVRLVAVATMAEAMDLPVARPFTATVEHRQMTLGGVRGDLYDPGPSAPGIVLVPGAAPAGLDDPRVVRLANAIARAGRAVFVPELDVYGQDLVVDDVEQIVRATSALAGGERGPAVLVGTSFGGSLGLLASADPRLDDQLALTATFGAYFDLVGVAQAVTTGTAMVDGQEVGWEPHPLAQEVVMEQLTSLLPSDQEAAVQGALAADTIPDDLEPDASAVHALLANDDPARTFPLADELPQAIRERLTSVSPSSVAEDLTGPIVAMHSTDDPAIPYGELVRLGARVPDAQLITLDHFLHVDLDLSSPRGWIDAISDLRGVWQFATIVLDAQERP